MNRFAGAVLAVVVVVAGLTGCADAAKDNAKKGDSLFKKKQYAEAAQAYEASLKANPDQEGMLEKLAAAYHEAGQKDRAEETLLKSIEAKQDPAAKIEGYRNLAGLFLKSGPLEKAETYFLKVVELNPKDESALQWLGEIASAQGGARSQAEKAKPEHLDRALTYYDRAIAVAPAQPNAYLNKRIALMKYINHLNQAAEAARLEAAAEAKDKAKAAELLATADQHQKREQELRVQLDETTKKLVELQKAAKK